MESVLGAWGPLRRLADAGSTPGAAWLLISGLGGLGALVRGKAS
jgi:hypothetical protein